MNWFKKYKNDLKFYLSHNIILKEIISYTIKNKTISYNPHVLGIFGCINYY